MLKKHHSTNLFKERITLFHKKWIEQSDGCFIQELQSFGTSWARLIPLQSVDVEKFHEWYGNKQRKPKFLYKIAMRKYFNSIARHADVNALGLKHKILEVISSMQINEEKTLLECIAADYGEET